MLKRPVLKAKATERPQRISGAASTISCPRVLRCLPPLARDSLVALRNPAWRMGTKPSFQACWASSARSTTSPSARPMTMAIRAAATDESPPRLRSSRVEVGFLSMAASLQLHPLGAGHVKTQLLHGDGFGVELYHQLTLVHDQNAVGEDHHL